MQGPIRVLVVDDSALMRHRLGAIIGSAAQFEVVGFANDGADCLEKLRTLQPDVVTLDVEMPGLDGFATLRQIMERAPTPVLMVSSLTEQGARTTLDALALGAVDYLAKPSILSMDAAGPFRVELLTKLGVVARVRMAKVTRHLGAQQDAAQQAPVRSKSIAPKRGSFTSVVTPAPTGEPRASASSPFRGQVGMLVVIGSSTGGPQALDHLFADLPSELSTAYLVIQHMPPLFTQSLAVRLSRRAGIPAREVEEGDTLASGQILVAPGGWHVTLGPDRRLHIDQTDPVHGVRPAVDRALLSIADHWRGPCLVAILTGMGVDGTAGARAIRARGMEVYAQDEASSIVFGMPRSVVEAGLATAVLPLDRMSPAIAAWARTPSGAAISVG